MALEHEVAALEKRWETWDVACRLGVADEIVANEMTRVRAENSRGGIPLATATALRDYEQEYRHTYDQQRATEGTVLDVDTNVQLAAVDEAITANAALRSERQVYGHSTDKALMAGVLEELQIGRLTQEFARLTVFELRAQYARLTDDQDRTAIRLIEAAVLDRGLSSLGLRPDPERDARAILDLQNDVATRRHARVPAQLHELRKRVQALRTLPRQHLMAHFAEGRGIARRPMTAIA